MQIDGLIHVSVDDVSWNPQGPVNLDRSRPFVRIIFGALPLRRRLERAENASRSCDRVRHSISQILQAIFASPVHDNQRKRYVPLIASVAPVALDPLRATRFVGTDSENLFDHGILWNPLARLQFKNVTSD